MKAFNGIVRKSVFILIYLTQFISRISYLVGRSIPPNLLCFEYETPMTQSLPLVPDA